MNGILHQNFTEKYASIPKHKSEVDFSKEDMLKWNLLFNNKMS